MIVWLNGPFGAGKTTVAAALREALPGSAGFDPELVGWALGRMVRVPSGDYQDLRSWRRLTVAIVSALDRVRPGPLVVPMALLREPSTSEVLGGLRARGHDLRHVLLDVTGEELGHRLGRGDGAAGAWRRAHVAEYERERARLSELADVVLDTTGSTPREVAASVRAALERKD